MANNPLNLAFRFILELSALVSAGYWGWTIGEGWIRWLSAIGLPLMLAVIWGVFRVNNDPNQAPVKIPGTLRLPLELAVLYGGALALFMANNEGLAALFAVLITVHYAISLDRVRWLIKQ